LAGDEGACLKQVGAPEAPALLLFEPQRAADFSIALFGAGHVGRALVHALAGLPCRITWIDSRDDQFPRDLPANVTVVCTDAPTAEVDAAAPGSYFLVMTHSHALDQELAEAILARNDFAYFGLIGSVSKRRAFEKRMKNRGVPPARFRHMTCPIGVPGISGKEPAAIAIAVAAEVLQARERRAAANPAHARELGIGMVFQHFSLFETLTVAENVSLALPGKPELGELGRRITEVSERYGLPVDPRRLVHSLSVGERQRVEIIRCLLVN